MKTKILFWNLHKKELSNLIIDVAQEQDVDILVFAEFKNLDIDHVLTTLKEYTYIPPIESKYKVIFIIKNSIKTHDFQNKNRYSLLQCNNNNFDFNIVGIHLQSQFTDNDAEREETIRRLLNDLSVYEKDNYNTILIGDFNIEPYSDEMVKFNLFNAVMFKDIIEKDDTKEFDDNIYKRFYNPMLSLISEDTKTYGSHYYTKSKLLWNFLDQCIIRKEMIKFLKEIAIIKKIKEINLCKNDQPNEEISDHLPLVVLFEGELDG